MKHTSICTRLNVLLVLLACLATSGCLAVYRENTQNWRGFQIDRWENGDRIDNLNPEGGGVWVSTEWDAKRRHVNLFPLWVWNTGRPPYAVGVSAFSYGGDWIELELTDLVLTQGSRKYHPVDKDNSVISTFEKWDIHPTATSIHAKCIVNIGEWPINDSERPIILKAVYTVRGLNVNISSEIVAEYTFEDTKTTDWFVPPHD